MARKLTAYRLRPDPAWYQAIRGAYARLDEHGQKKRVTEAANIGRSTAHRIVTGDDDLVSYDTMEALRLAINDELKADEIPPAFIPVRSTAHAEAAQALGAMDERGKLEAALEWMKIGEELASVGIFDAMLEALRRRVAAERESAQSSEAIDGRANFAARTSVGRATNVEHGKGRHRGSG